MKQYAVYILASQKNGTIYIGVTGNLQKRIEEHKSGKIAGFTKKYKVHDLVYFEVTKDIYAALNREKQLKTWKRSYKVDLIEEKNLEWNDLSKELF